MPISQNQQTSPLPPSSPMKLRCPFKILPPEQTPTGRIVSRINIYGYLVCLLVFAPNVGCTIHLVPKPPPIIPQQQAPPPVVENSLVSMNFHLPLSLSDASICRHYGGRYPVETDIADGWFDYEAWRGPFMMEYSGDSFDIKGNIFFWIDGLLGKFIGFSAGADDEPARSLNTGLKFSLKWSDEWNIFSTTTPLKIINDNRVLVTVMDIDLTDTVNKAVGNLLNSAAKKIDTRISAFGNLRPKAETAWDKLQEPVDLGYNKKLHIRPLSASVEPFIFSANEIKLSTNLSMRLEILDNQSLVPEKTSFQKLNTETQLGDKIKLITDIGISFSELTKYLKEPTTGIVGKTLTYNSWTGEINDISVYDGGNRIIIKVDIDVKSKHLRIYGPLYFSGNIGYDISSKSIQVTNLELDKYTNITVRNWFTWLGKQEVLNAINGKISFNTESIQLILRDNIEKSLNRTLAQNISIKSKIEKLECQLIYYTKDNILLRTSCEGMSEILIEPDLIPPPVSNDCLNQQGWFIKIYPQDTESAAVGIEVGVGGDKNSHRYWREWHRGEPSEFPFPDDLRHIKEVWVNAISREEKEVSMRILFNGHVTQKMNFHKDEQHETSRDDHD